MKIWLPTIRTESGADVYTIRLARALESIGVETHISWFSQGYELLPWLLKGVAPPDGTTHIQANSWTGTTFLRQGIPFVSTVHHWVHAPEYAPYRSRLQGIYHRAHVRPLELAALKSADCVVSVSQHTANCISRDCPDLQTVVISNAIDSRFFRPAETEKEPPVRPYRILFVGNHSQRKGFDLLAPIMQKLGGEYQLRYTGGIRDKGPASIPHSIPLGKLTDDALLAEYQRAAVVLVPSRYEGFGYVACEAMSCGIPVVASDIGGLNEVINHDSSGVLCPVNDQEAFSLAIKMICENPNITRNFGHRGREKVLAEYSLRQMAERYISVYENCRWQSQHR